MFGRRKRDEDEETAKEAERRALFEELAKRPDTVCPFLGLASARAEYRPEPNGEHRCYAFGDPAPLADEQQRHVCLERGYSNCPRYLRGVLVIPSEELEALRRPQPHVAPPPPPRRPVAGRRSRRGLLVIPLIVVLLAAIGAGGWYLVNNNGGIAIVPSPTPSAALSFSPLPSATATAIVVPSSGILPTPGPSDIPTGGYAVYVKLGSFPVFVLDASGTVTAQRTAVFSRVSAAPVERVVGADGAIYWRTLFGNYTGLAYTKGRSGDFEIYEVYRTPTGEGRFRLLPETDL